MTSASTEQRGRVQYQYCTSSLRSRRRVARFARAFEFSKSAKIQIAVRWSFRLRDHSYGTRSLLAVQVTM
jgi:hypothetical protein